ncbi:trigger factor [Paenibacillus hemerocallicola]|jgi:trigger factor|uniref:Trigger factor n=1 Tax=Paenibacillus hemerocallicola TaxID=1172614 RepID=A0A5C4TDA4_9BACL|nr:trigger factor [Paenibacillus hemerocallicola]TNJ66487.1 trigger factor [Paenibacillus hemerocallicola]
MKATWEKIEKNKVVLNVEVDAEQVAVALDKAFKKVAAKANIPGFRKGKVPRQIFEAKFGVESLYQDALDILLPEVYVQAVEESSIEPVDRPDVEIEQFGKGQALIFKATVIVKPEVQLGEYKGLEVEQKADAVSEDEIAEELKRLQQRHAELVVLEEGTAENGDIAVIDFEGFVDGVPFEGGKGESHSLELGSGSFIPGFEEQVVGLAKGEEKDVNVTFPEEYHSEELKGKEAVFKVTVRDIKRKNLPELDDEFAKDVSEFDTLDEFKQDIVTRLQERKQKSNEQELESSLVEKAAANAEVEVPEAMITTEVEQMYTEFGNRLQMQGMDLAMYLQFTGQDEATVKQQMRTDAARRVRNNLVIEAIAKAESISASEEEINEELERLSSQYQRSTDELRAILSANGSLDTLQNDLTSRKTIAFLVENSKAVEVA